MAMAPASAPACNLMNLETPPPTAKRVVTTSESPPATGASRNESRAVMLGGDANARYPKFVPVNCVALISVTDLEPVLATATIWPAVVSFSNASLQAPASATTTATATACRLTSPIPVQCPTFTAPPNNRVRPRAGKFLMSWYLASNRFSTRALSVNPGQAPRPPQRVTATEIDPRVGRQSHAHGRI